MNLTGKYRYPAAKTKRTYYTDQKINNARKNIKKFEWAQKEYKQIIKKADAYLEFGADRAFWMITQQNIPRSVSVNQIKGCPICGRKIDAYGNYPYEVDIFNKPFKVTCPTCGSMFPSNDFESYYKSGLDENGMFCHPRADRRYLVNELYPDKPADWCVDDGFGWVDPNDHTPENKYTFIAYFDHWNIWYTFNSDVWRGENRPPFFNLVQVGLNTLSKAYLFTGDKKYAHFALVMLCRIAEIYPSLDSGAYRWQDGYRNSHGFRMTGKAVGCIWECCLAIDFCLAYDALFDAIDDEFAEIISNKAEYKNNAFAPKTTHEVKACIENGILREIFPAVLNYNIMGNVGLNHRAVATAILVLQDQDVARKWIPMIFEHTNDDFWGPGNLLKVLTNEVDRDGYGYEVSPGYNRIWPTFLEPVANMLADNKEFPQYDLYKNIKFRKMFHLEKPFIIFNRYILALADGSKASDPGISLETNAYISFFEQTKDPVVAQLLDLNAKANNLEFICTDIFCDAERLEKEITQSVQEHGQFQSISNHMTGFGISTFCYQDKDGDKAAYCYYGRNMGHGHRDVLQLGLLGFGVNLTPDHGYPCFADNNYERRRWTIAPISHNCVTVDRDGEQAKNIRGIPHHYSGSGPVMTIDVEAPCVYPETKCYRRSVITVNIGGEGYTLDLFRIDGGNEHLYSFHGAEGIAKASGLQLIPQNTGTYAGEDIEWKSFEYDEKHTDGYDYLYNVERASNPDTGFSVDWKIEDTWKVWDSPKDVHLRLTMLSKNDEVALADGEPPQNKPGNPKSYRYLLAKRNGTDLKSRFMSLIEPYENIRNVKSIEALPLKGENSEFDGCLVKVCMENGRTDYIFNSISNKTYTYESFEFSGYLAVLSYQGEKLISSYLNDAALTISGSPITSQTLCLTGKVIDFTKEYNSSNYIDVAFDNENIPDLTGLDTDIEPIENSNGCYTIQSATKLDNGIYRLFIGDVTLINHWADIFDFSKGYVYDIEVGSNVKIPLTYSNGNI